MLGLLFTTVNAQNLGSWAPIGQSGVVCIHSYMLPNSKLVCVERPHEGVYPPNPFTGSTLSTEIDLSKGNNVTYVQKPVRNNPFCAGHSQTPNGGIFVAGGDNKTLDDATVVNGRRGKRLYTPCTSGDCSNGGSWTILEDMTTERWYPTVLTLHTGNMMIIGGTTKNLDLDNLLLSDNNPTYEYHPPKPASDGAWPRKLDILEWAFPFNLYPQAFQTPSGEVVLVVSNRTVMINPETDALRNLDDMPILDHRPWIYPFTPTAFVLPMTKSNNYAFEIMICGGTKLSSLEASNMCLGLKPNDARPSWTIKEGMPQSRLMPDSVLLPDGTVLVTNGLMNGTAGGNQGQTQYASQPLYSTLLYTPSTGKWTTLAPYQQKRLYHSGSLLTAKGTVVSMGSEFDNYDDYWVAQRSDCFPNAERMCTDPFNYNLEEFTPPYLSITPKFTIQETVNEVTYDSLIKLKVSGGGKAKDVKMVSFVRMGTTTHSTNTDQRFIELDIVSRANGDNNADLFVRIPKDGKIAPPGNWFVFIVGENGSVSEAKIVLLKTGAKTEVEIPKGASNNSAFGSSVSFVIGLVGLITLVGF